MIRFRNIPCSECGQTPCECVRRPENAMVCREGVCHRMDQPDGPKIVFREMPRPNIVWRETPRPNIVWRDMSGS